MSTLREHAGSNGSPPVRPSTPPLVIVSERGRHSEAARRIVRAQAARASAAQSRETRARNREDRTAKDGPLSPPLQSTPAPAPVSPAKPSLAQPAYIPSRPLVSWITNVLQLSTGSFVAGAAVLAATGQPRLNDAASSPRMAGLGMPLGALPFSSSDPFDRRLPIALPRGFAALQQRLHISDAFLAVISRTACFDFASPGVQERLNQLLFDIVMASAAAGMADSDRAFHPIQAYVRVACTCLTIFQAQRADGAPLGLDAKYASGLDAALAESMLLDQTTVREPKAAEAALWAVFVISVTTGATASRFYNLLCSLMSDLNLTYWEHVRGVLLEFIYPGSCLDEPCRLFFDQLRRQPAYNAQ